jgi:hypothetical protein
MSLIKPKGKFNWQASTAADVVQYNLYGKQADADPPESTVLAPENLLYSIPVVAGQTDYSINLSDIPGLLGANGENFVFSVASQDGSGNVSDFSNVAVIPLDETPPDAPTNFTYTPE